MRFFFEITYSVEAVIILDSAQKYLLSGTSPPDKFIIHLDNLHFTIHQS